MFTQPVQRGSIPTSPLLAFRPRDSNSPDPTRKIPSPSSGAGGNTKIRLSESVYRIGFTYPHLTTTSAPATSLSESSTSASSGKASTGKWNSGSGGSAGSGGTGGGTGGSLFKGKTDKALFHTLSKLSRENCNLRRDREALTSAVDFYINRECQSGGEGTFKSAEDVYSRFYGHSHSSRQHHHHHRPRPKTAAAGAGRKRGAHGERSKKSALKSKSYSEVSERSKCVPSGHVGEEESSVDSAPTTPGDEVLLDSTCLAQLPDGSSDPEAPVMSCDLPNAHVCIVDDYGMDTYMEEMERSGYLSAETVENFQLLCDEMGVKADKENHVDLLRLALIDDEVYSLNNLTSLLRESGYEVSGFSNIREGGLSLVDSCGRGKLDGIVLSGQTSLDDLEYIRRELKLGDIPVFPVVGMDKDEIRSAFEKGASGVLARPVRFGVLQKPFLHEVSRAKKYMKEYQNISESRRREKVCEDYFLNMKDLISSLSEDWQGAANGKSSSNTVNGLLGRTQLTLKGILEDHEGDINEEVKSKLQGIIDSLTPEEEPEKTTEAKDKVDDELAKPVLEHPAVAAHLISAKSSLGDNPDKLRQILSQREFDQWNYSNGRLALLL